MALPDVIIVLAAAFTTALVALCWPSTNAGRPAAAPPGFDDIFGYWPLGRHPTPRWFALLPNRGLRPRSPDLKILLELNLLGYP